MQIADQLRIALLPRNILIFHAGALGDFIQTFPLGLALGRLYPQSRIMYVTQRQKGALAEKLLALESIDVESGWHHLFGDASKLPDVCRAKLAAAHTVVTFFARPGDAWIDSVKSIAPKAQIISADSGPARQIQASLSAWAIVRTAMSQILTSTEERGIPFPSAAGPKIIAIHPGAGSPAKCWPLDSFLNLVSRLQAASHSCKIILGEVELERWPAEQIRRIESAAQTVRPATYLELLSEISGSAAFVGNDSGPAHLAAIIGVPTLVLFGPATSPADWKPIGPRVATVRKERMDWLAVDDDIAHAGLMSLLK